MIRKKRKDVIARKFDRENEIPVIRSSICTGEKVAGFKDKKTGHFEEVMLLKNEADQELFLQTYGIALSEIKKEW
ncbi:MAG: hypothetical protein NC417_12535 [Candidatus Gastranaerophilales bacterium]|nr:hypothetical protein [Candidatus Gastranaerophilales bacterium]